MISSICKSNWGLNEESANSCSWVVEGPQGSLLVASLNFTCISVYPLRTFLVSLIAVRYIDDGRWLLLNVSRDFLVKNILHLNALKLLIKRPYLWENQEFPQRS
eukprot:NODE_448_length_8440_cov_0.772329.p7 type:complete len:104 gc:universal NODE_448_length_8440_cov_0.772329:1724-2035(+)